MDKTCKSNEGADEMIKSDEGMDEMCKSKAGVRVNPMRVWMNV